MFTTQRANVTMSNCQSQNIESKKMIGELSLYMMVGC